jgi:hypothetical protein
VEGRLAAAAVVDRPLSHLVREGARAGDDADLAGFMDVALRVVAVTKRWQKERAPIRGGDGGLSTAAAGATHGQLITQLQPPCLQPLYHPPA